MDFLRIVFVFSIFALYNVAGENITCPENEIPKCESACAPTCQNRNPSKICTEQCARPCSCKQDYIRESPGGMCVPKTCQGVNKLCKKHEKSVTCPSACPRICDQIPPKVCTKMCLLVGCVCEDGYVRETEGGECIKNDKCNQKCDENESYDSCGTECPPRSSEPSPECSKQCTPGCFCNEGYILDDSTLKCIKKKL